jgi:hypothetical protein
MNALGQFALIQKVGWIRESIMFLGDLFMLSFEGVRPSSFCFGFSVVIDNAIPADPASAMFRKLRVPVCRYAMFDRPLERFPESDLPLHRTVR